MGRRAIGCLAALSFALAGLGGCGGEDSDSGDDPSDLTRYLPTESRYIGVIDLAAARSELELPEDADPAALDAFKDGGFKVDDPESLLISAAALGSPELSNAIQLFEETPIVEALDGAAISALASNQGDPEHPVSVIRTTQEFDDLATALEDAGYERDGDTLSNSDETPSEIANAGDGVIVLTGEGESASELVDDPPGGVADLTEVAAPDEGSIGLAALGFGDTCLTAFGGSENAASESGELRMRIDETVDVDRVQVDELPTAAIDAGEPTTDGDLVTIPFTADLDATGSVINRLVADLSFLSLYDCG